MVKARARTVNIAQAAMNRNEFIAFVRDYVTADPAVAAHIPAAIEAGISANLEEAKDRLAAMEVIAMMLASRKYATTDAVILAKLKELQGKTFCNWDAVIEKLRKDVDKLNSKA
jgi:hypothetical protein